jgi:hypothetical protein
VPDDDTVDLRDEGLRATGSQGLDEGRDRASLRSERGAVDGGDGGDGGAVARFLGADEHGDIPPPVPSGRPPVFPV